MPMQRRSFLKSVTRAAAGPVALSRLLVQPDHLVAAENDQSPFDLPRPAEIVRNGMRYRALGRTGVQVSLIGVGGSHIGKQKREEESIHLIRDAIGLARVTPRSAAFP
jgi:hypothetical protein